VPAGERSQFSKDILIPDDEQLFVGTLSDVVKASAIGVKKLTAILSFPTKVRDSASLFSTLKRRRIWQMRCI
jgi:hypothetical protein